MIHLLVGLSKFVPTDCFKTVYDIDYNKLYDEGKRIILIDIDNTLIPYDEELPNDQLKRLFNKIKEIGFDVVTISNNHKPRVKKFSDELGVNYISYATKPLKRGYKKALKKLNIKDKSIVISIGDQIMTDIYGSRKMKLDCILVKALKRKSEKWYTKLNRKLEINTLKSIKKKYPEMYKKIEEINNEI